MRVPMLSSMLDARQKPHSRVLPAVFGGESVAAVSPSPDAPEAGDVIAKARQ
jgi:hypothetical protein